MYQTNDVDSAWNRMEKMQTKTIDSHAPIISKRIKGKRSPWIILELKKEMNRCHALRRKFQRTNTEEDHKSYKNNKIKPTF